MSLYPNTAWRLEGFTYGTLEWLDTNTIPKPPEDILVAEVARLQAEYDALEYQRQRAAEYPDPRLYFDAIVKGNNVQKQAYIDACLAVKAKYPKT